MRHLIEDTLDWANDRGIILSTKEQALAQMKKVREEVFELQDAIERGTEEEQQLELGDVVVTLIVTAANLGMDIEDALGAAYDKIKGRKGRLVDGVFVKET